MKRTSRKSSSSQSSKAFRVVGVERIRERTAKVYVDAGRDGELWVTVYPDPLPMRVFSASSNVQWLESDLTDAQRKQVRLAASRALASNGRFKRTSRMAANAEWVTGHHFPEFKTRAAAEEWAKTKIKGQPWKVFSLQRWGGSHDRTVWKAHVQEGYAFRGVKRNPEAKLDKQDRAMINESLVRAGLDGNGRFRSVGMALSAASDVLDDYGLEPDEVLSAWKFSGPSGHTQIRVAESNRNDPFSPVPIENSVLAFSWHQLAEGRWEAIAYMS